MSQEALDIPGLLRRHGLRPNKRLGQNFLVDPVHLQRVVSVAGVQPEDAVLEVGAGLGSLTRLLAEAARKVVGVELDQRLIPALQEVLAPYPNVEVVQGDILTLHPQVWLSRLETDQERGFVVVANIPYYITSALIRHLLESEPPPKRLTLTLQKEVAERICAEPGDLSLLALSVQVYGQPTIEAHIPAGAFYPVPKVDSSVVLIQLFDSPRIPQDLLPDFFQLAKAGFSQKRKTLRNALSGGMHWPASEAEDRLQAAGIDPMRRAETLSLEEWGQLTHQATD
jgi:16S rRNA (adenine1518-N6/adenine1519-N6)-dimethyltransferase